MSLAVAGGDRHHLVHAFLPACAAGRVRRRIASHGRPPSGRTYWAQLILLQHGGASQSLGTTDPPARSLLPLSFSDTLHSTTSLSLVRRRTASPPLRPAAARH